MSLLDDFLTRAWLAGFGIATMAGPLGCFIVWRRMAYFGDATAHATVLGVALAVFFSAPVWIGALILALVMALAVSRLSRRGIGSDTALGVLSHGALGVGLLVAQELPGPQFDLISLLAGDLLAVSRSDVLLILLAALAVLGWLWWRWSALLTATLNPDLARASGIDPEREELGFTLALAVVVALSIKLVGVLLIASLLILPAAAARPLANSPERMALWAAALGIASVAAGLWASATLDWQTGPAIVTAAALIFCTTGLWQSVKKAA